MTDAFALVILGILGGMSVVLGVLLVLLMQCVAALRDLVNIFEDPDQ